MVVFKTSDHIQIKIKMFNPSQEPPASLKAPNEDLKDIDNFAPSKSNERLTDIKEIQNYGSLS